MTSTSVTEAGHVHVELPTKDVTTAQLATSETPAYHVMTPDEALQKLQSNRSSGLTESEAKERLGKYGENVLPSSPPKTVLERLWAQINSVLIYVLLAGAALSFGFEHHVDGVVIIAVIVINVGVGYYMEGKAENTTKLLKEMMSATAWVIRDSEKKEIDTSNLTLGDIIFLQGGDVVPADGRILTCADLAVLEAALTGESHAVQKTMNALSDASKSLAERKCMVFAGTQVIKGSAVCVVTCTGAYCEVGKISSLLKEVKDQKTPLELKLEEFGVYLSYIILALALLALIVALLRGYSIAVAFSFAIGIAVAAIPEGLPSCVTITFAVGVQHMAKQRAIVKSLPAVETLGSVSVICSDKTGTLTQNCMTVKAIVTSTSVYKLTDQGRVTSVSREDEQGDMHVSERRASRAEEHHDLLSFLLPGILCSDSTVNLANTVAAEEDISKDDIENRLMTSTFTVKGDPTEACILTLAARLNDNPAHIKQLQNQFGRLAEVPFDSANKFMATLHTLPVTLLSSSDTVLASPERQSAQRIVMVKGAPERVLRFTSLTEPEKAYWLRRGEALASEGMRVLGLAYKTMRDDYDVDTTPLLEEITQHGEGFTLHALVGILDPPRGEAIIAVQHAQEAGITVKMITGDHPGTALAIAKQLGMAKTTKAITGQELDANIDKLQEIVLEYDVFARTTPEHKLRIVQALQAQDKICSMTGDGVNDAPALKAANIGVAMGITGTEVAKDAGKMIITDDNFATIVEAIKVGRCTYNNLIKTLAFVLPTNGGQAFSIIMALIIGVEVPITALQILWVNMATSITLGLIFAFEPAHDEIMQQPPRRMGKGVFGKFLSWRVFYVSALLVIAVLVNFQWERDDISSLNKLRTGSVNTLCAGQIGYVFNCRNLRGNTGLKGLFTGNKVIYLGIVLACLLQVIFTYAPPFQYVFQTEDLDAKSWGKIAFWGMFVFVMVEIEKFVNSLRYKKWEEVDNMD